MTDELLETAETYYTDELPYHNFEHVQDTLEAANQLFKRCREYGVELDEEAVETALYFHDARYQDDHEAEGFETKEDLSKQVAREELREYGYNEEFIQRVTDCIEATKHQAEPETNEQVATRASDLRGLMGSTEEFLENTEALWEEQKILYDNEPDYEKWVEDTLNGLLHYWWQELELTPEHRTEEGYSEFHIQLGENIRAFKDEYITDEIDVEIKAK